MTQAYHYHYAATVHFDDGQKRLMHGIIANPVPVTESGYVDFCRDLKKKSDGARLQVTAFSFLGLYEPVPKP